MTTGVNVGLIDAGRMTFCILKGADELDAISHELKEFERTDVLEAKGQMSEIDQQLAEALEEPEE